MGCKYKLKVSLWAAWRNYWQYARNKVCPAASFPTNLTAKLLVIFKQRRNEIFKLVLVQTYPRPGDRLTRHVLWPSNLGGERSEPAMRLCTPALIALFL